MTANDGARGEALVLPAERVVPVTQWCRVEPVCRPFALSRDEQVARGRVGHDRGGPYLPVYAPLDSASQRMGI